MNPSLFRPNRVCLACGCEASSGSKTPVPSEPIIVAINPTVTRRGTGKSVTQAAISVRICEKCLAKAASDGRLIWGGKEAEKLGRAIAIAAQQTVENMAATDAFAQVHRPDWRNPQELLL